MKRADAERIARETVKAWYAMSIHDPLESSNLDALVSVITDAVLASAAEEREMCAREADVLVHNTGVARWIADNIRARGVQ